MKQNLILILMLMVLSSCASTGNSPGDMADDPAKLDVQEAFDYMGPVIHQFKLSSGKTVAYVDEGEKDWLPVLYVGGAGTAARAMSLTEFARTLRHQLNLRIISIGRNGLGQTEYAAEWGYQDYAKEVKEVLNHLGVNNFVGLAISGGGPYLAAVAAELPDRIVSLHLAAALTQSPADAWNCKGTFEDTAKTMRGYATRPLVWWNLGENTSVARVPGFQDTANEDGARSFYMRGQLYDEDNDPRKRVEHAVTEEYRRFCTKVPDTSAVKAPAFIYQGLKDTSVPAVHAENWKKKLKVKKIRFYPGEGHDIQYRHWDQIMLDMAGYSDFLIICKDGTSMIVPENEGVALVSAGKATLGICAWQTGARR